ncbi:MAG: type II toxin-antitoxin system PemK/MazF family toxin [Bacteroidia bacterium]|nr:type II toxin-antitoxin system PemK/MazF family toxin [Bacteroidia bacterium]
MSVKQRDIIELNFLLPDGVSKPHPAIVISNDELFEDEGFFYCCLISTKHYNPQYIFELSNTMLIKPLSKKSFVKCQIIGGFTERDIIKQISGMRPEPFRLLIDKVKQSVF